MERNYKAEIEAILFTMGESVDIRNQTFRSKKNSKRNAKRNGHS